MLSTIPYLHFMGNTLEAMNFYKSVFGGEITVAEKFRNIPGGEKMSVEDQEKYIHISLVMRNGVTLMATDALESMGQNLTFGNNFHICMQAESETEVDQLFERLSKGGKVEMPVNKTFFGSYFGMAQDRFGVQWMINYVYPQNKKL